MFEDVLDALVQEGDEAFPECVQVRNSFPSMAKDLAEIMLKKKQFPFLKYMTIFFINLNEKFRHKQIIKFLQGTVRGGEDFLRPLRRERV